MDRTNSHHANVSQIKKFAILDHDLSLESGDLTPTLKVKRAVVQQKYAAQLDALYERWQPSRRGLAAGNRAGATTGRGAG